MNKQGVVIVALALTLLSLVMLSGCTRGHGGPGGGKHGAPPEAIAACEGKAVGDSVEFIGRHGDTVKATCKEINGQLAAMPNDVPKDGGRQ